ncbi:MAG: aminotransferase class V-fold PLP-dependent enzyme [Actinomycetota bacterium]|nr:aminotransferase class V-fold PLP-dependent enzyme [Actinomycetota bacterium]
MSALEDYLDSFTDEPGYLDFARVGPVGRRVSEEEAAQSSLLGRARFGTMASLLQEQDVRVRAAVGVLTGFPPERVVYQPNASQGLMHTMFGLTGQVAMSPAEFPSITIAASRAADALHVLDPVWLETDHGRVTPGNLQDQLDQSIVAVAVSLVDFRTGYLVDLEGIRQVIGDRLLIVDASQAFPIVDAPYPLADVVIGNGQKWARAGWGTGFLALSERALDQLVPVFSGFNATDVEPMPLDEVPAPSRSAKAFQVSNPDPIAQARFSAALEQVAEVGVPVVNTAIAERAERVMELADEFGVGVDSPRARAERAGIVVLRPEDDALTVLTAALHNQGLTVTVRGGAVRVSAHVSTTDETLDMLRAALVEYRAATPV